VPVQRCTFTFTGCHGLSAIHRYNVTMSQAKILSILIDLTCQRIRCLGHTERMQHTAIPKKMLYRKLYATRRKGRRKIRWLDDVSTDLRKMGNKRMERHSKGLRGLEAYCKVGQGPHRGAVAPSKNKKTYFSTNTTLAFLSMLSPLKLSS